MSSNNPSSSSLAFTFNIKTSKHRRTAEKLRCILFFALAKRYLLVRFTVKISANDKKIDDDVMAGRSVVTREQKEKKDRFFREHFMIK
jgi:hypothetical protein